MPWVLFLNELCGQPEGGLNYLQLFSILAATFK